MSNEHIGRKQSIGLGKEGTSGTSVSATTWIPKIDGQFTPTNFTADDTGAYGVIDALRDQQLIKTISTVDFSCDLRDGYAGDLLMALFGTETPCVRIPIPGSITGTFVVGETITESTSLATGVLIRADVGGSSKVLFISVATGTFAGSKTLTGGTSSATATGGSIESQSAVRSHVYTLANTNTHPSYTIYGTDPVGTSKAVYCMLDTLDLEIVSGQYAVAKAKYMGKKVQSGSGTASFTAQNAFLSKYANFYDASVYTSLDAASPVTIKSMKINFKKNLTDYLTWGATDVSGFFNRQFEVSGDFVLLYNATTYRDYVTTSNQTRSFRVKLANTDVTIGSAANPTIQFDFPVVSFKDWKRSTNNNDIVEQTILWKAQYDVTTSMTCGCILQNSTITAY